MANLKYIRDRIKSVKSIQQVTSAMRMVAAAKLRRAQERMEQARPYEQRLQEVINNLLPDVNRGMLDLLQVRKVNRIGYLIVTSDRGLAGAFNTNVIKKAESEIEEIGRENTDLFCIGREGRNHFKKRDWKVYPNLVTNFGFTCNHDCSLFRDHRCNYRVSDRRNGGIQFLTMDGSWHGYDVSN